MLRRRSLQSEIIDYIRKYIEENKLEAGDKLPSQAVLQKQMGVSRVALREAIKTLEAKEVLEVLNGKGIYVRELKKSIISAQIEFKKEKESLLELIEVRRIFEREIIKLLIENAKDEEIEEIGKVLKILMQKYYRGVKQNQEDKLFHQMIHKFSHNKVIYQLMLSIDEMMDHLWQSPLQLESPFTDTIPLHEELYNALKDRNVRKARAINNKILDAICHEVKEAKL